MSRTIQLTLAALALASVLGATALAQAQRRAFLPLVITTGSAQTELHTGEATYYVTANGDGNCSFGPSPDDLMVAAIGYLDYGNPDPSKGPAAVYCGAYVEVYGPNATIRVRIVDKCPDVYVPPSTGCAKGHLDLSPEAFAKIAPLSKGRVPITWRVVSPDLGRPIAYHIQKDSSQWWTAIQVRHHRNPIVKLEYRTTAGAWVPMVRQDWNYFTADTMGPGPYTLRVTDTYGNVLQDSGIALTPGGPEQPGGGQFPPGP